MTFEGLSSTWRSCYFCRKVLRPQFNTFSLSASCSTHIPLSMANQRVEGSLISIEFQSKPATIKRILPAEIERKCRHWESFFDMEYFQTRYGEYKTFNCTWLKLKLRCIRVKVANKTVTLYLKCEPNEDDKNSPYSTEEAENYRFDRKNWFPSKSLLLRPIDEQPSTLVANGWTGSREKAGILGALLDDKSGLIIYLNDPDINRTNIQKLSLTPTFFEVRHFPSGKMLQNNLDFLKKRNNWPNLPGYDAMLYAHKCKPLLQIPIDGRNAIEGNRNRKFTQRKKALAAALDPNLPLLSLNAFTQETANELLLKYVRLFIQQRPKAMLAVFSSSIFSHYQLIARYVALFPDNEHLNFAVPEKITYDLMAKFVQNPTVRQRIERRFILKLPKELLLASCVRESYETNNKIKNILDGYPDIFQKSVSDAFLDQKLKAAQSDYNQQLRRVICQGTNVLFLSKSGSRLSIVTDSLNIRFDGVVFADANHWTEFDAWKIILSTSSHVRLFGVDPEVLPAATRQSSEKSILHFFHKQFGKNLNLRIK